MNFAEEELQEVTGIKMLNGNKGVIAEYTTSYINVTPSAHFWNFSFKVHDRPYFVTFTVIHWLDVYPRNL